MASDADVPGKKKYVYIVLTPWRRRTCTSYSALINLSRNDGQIVGWRIRSCSGWGGNWLSCGRMWERGCVKVGPGVSFDRPPRFERGMQMANLHNANDVPSSAKAPCRTTTMKPRVCRWSCRSRFPRLLPSHVRHPTLNQSWRHRKF